ncbi:hypothetical protein, partial [Bradyrhizobium sp.]|uniref:hypothetical protein n=1 Tax=Bradyrhizobium sp. TaxID=376 RepID=UPI0025BD438A
MSGILPKADATSSGSQSGDTGYRTVAVIFAGRAARRPSPRENAGRLDAGSLSGSCPKYAMVCVIPALTAGSI